MQKFTKLLEQHVQWLAVGLAGLYLLWMAWTYILHVPASVKIGSAQVDPGLINKTIKDEAITPLDNAVKVDNSSFHIEVPNLLTPWLAAVNSSPTSVAVLPTVFPPNLGNQKGFIVDPRVKNGALLAALPALPAAEPIAVSQVRTSVIFPDPAWVAPKNNPQAQPTTITEHRDIDSSKFRIKVKELQDAFAKVIGPNLPPQLNNSMFLLVTLMREEQQPDGSWGKPTVVPPLALHPMNKFPGDKAKPISGLEYQEWASAHQNDILHPAFYQVAAGSKAYEEPGAPVAPVPGGPGGSGPGTLTPPPPPPVTSTPPRTTGRKPAPGNTPGGMGPGMVGPGGYNPGGGTGPNSGRGAKPGSYPGPSMPNTLQPPPYQPISPGTYPGGSPGYPGGNPGTMQPPGGMFGQQQQPQGPGIVDITTLTSDITIIAHDETVVEGKTYRYSVSYKMLNPAYQATKIIQDPTLADIFAMTSPVSKPTETITVPTRTDLFVKSIRSNEVKFDVFNWKGVETKNEVSASPGDLVAPTDWTVVDIRQDNKGREQLWYVILVNKAGQIVRHDFRSDQSDPRYKDLLDMVKAPEAAAARTN